jgi:hypothetical protein
MFYTRMRTESKKQGMETSALFHTPAALNLRADSSRYPFERRMCAAMNTLPGMEPRLLDRLPGGPYPLGYIA